MYGLVSMVYDKKKKLTIYRYNTNTYIFGQCRTISHRNEAIWNNSYVYFKRVKDIINLKDDEFTILVQITYNHKVMWDLKENYV